MKKLFLQSVLVFIAVWLPNGVHADSDSVTQFKGYVSVNRVLQERLVRPGQAFELATYLDEYYSAFGGGLLDLLGTYGKTSLDSAFQNGEPNVINMVLWHVAFSGLARDLGALCMPNGASPLAAGAQPSLIAALKPVCGWPDESARSDDALMGVWLAFMSFDAPMCEFDAWRDFFKSPVFANANARDTVAAMALAAFNNPYFLLRK